MKGRQLRIYLVDGTPTGILTAEIINWTGKVIVAPRSQLADLALRPEVRRTGIYCLVGPDPSNPLRDRIYVGEGDSVMARLLQHAKDENKDFWTRAVVVISKDDNITKSHGRYLESQLIRRAVAASRASVGNGTSPDVPPLPEPDVADMDFFLAQLEMIFPVLGMNFLLPQPVFSATASAAGEQSPRFVMTDVGNKAYAAEIGGEFVVFKGSTARKQGAESWQSYKSLRQELIDDNKLVHSQMPEYYVFAEDVAFSSPSAAAAVVAAGERNGRYAWKDEETGRSCSVEKITTGRGC